MAAHKSDKFPSPTSCNEGLALCAPNGVATYGRTRAAENSLGGKLNLVIGVILEHFGGQAVGKLTMEQMEEYREIWLKYDPIGSYTIPVEKLPVFLQKLPAPLGLFDVANPPTRSEVFARMGELQIPNHEGEVHFHKILLAIVNRLCGVNLPVF